MFWIMFLESKRKMTSPIGKFSSRNFVILFCCMDFCVFIVLKMVKDSKISTAEHNGVTGVVNYTVKLYFT
jgi:hypothetical protein